MLGLASVWEGVLACVMPASVWGRRCAARGGLPCRDCNERCDEHRPFPSPFQAQESPQRQIGNNPICRGGEPSPSAPHAGSTQHRGDAGAVCKHALLAAMAATSKRAGDSTLLIAAGAASLAAITVASAMYLLQDTHQEEDEASEAVKVCLRSWRRNAKRRAHAPCSRCAWCRPPQWRRKTWQKP